MQQRASSTSRVFSSTILGMGRPRRVLRDDETQIRTSVVLPRDLLEEIDRLVDEQNVTPAVEVVVRASRVSMIESMLRFAVEARRRAAEIDEKERQLAARETALRRQELSAESNALRQSRSEAKLAARGRFARRGARAAGQLRLPRVSLAALGVLLESDEPLTCAAIANRTGYVSKTVRPAILKLAEVGLVREGLVRVEIIGTTDERAGPKTWSATLRSRRSEA